MTSVTTMLCPTCSADLRVGWSEALVWCPRCRHYFDREFLRPRDETPCSTCGHRLAGHGPRWGLACACSLSTCTCNAKETTTMPRLIRSSVEYPGGTDVEYYPLPEGWDDWDEAQQDAYCVEAAVTHQTNIAPCGASVENLDDTQLARLRRDGLLIE